MIKRLSISVLALATIPLFTAIGCATTAATANSPEVNTSTTHANVMTGGIVETEEVASGVEIRVIGKPASALSTLMQVYADLKIPIGTLDPKSGLIGNSGFSVPGHNLAGKPLSTYLDCGQESGLGKRTELDEVIVSILSSAVAAGDSGTLVTTELKGYARPSSNSSNMVPCETNGTLEHQINVRLAAALATGA